MINSTDNNDESDAFASSLPPPEARPPKKGVSKYKTLIALSSVLLVFGSAAGVAILVSNLSKGDRVASSSNVAADVSDEKLEVFGQFDEKVVAEEVPVADIEVVEDEPVVEVEEVVEKVEPIEWEEEVDCDEEPVRARTLQNSGGQASVQLFNRRVMTNQKQLLRGGRRLTFDEVQSSSSKKVSLFLYYIHP